MTSALFAALVLLADANAANGKHVRTDFYGDPLPPGAVARLGTLRLRQRQLRSAEGVAVHVPAVSPNGKTIASGDYNGTLRLWNVTTGKLLQVEEKIDSWLRFCLFSPDGKLMISVRFQDSNLQVWDAATGKSLRRLKVKASNHEAIVLHAVETQRRSGGA